MGIKVILVHAGEFVIPTCCHQPALLLPMSSTLHKCSLQQDECHHDKLVLNFSVKTGNNARVLYFV